MPVEVCYSSVSCNRTPYCASWGRNGLVLYGACQAVALYQPESSSHAGYLKQTLVKHKDRVNCVRWMHNLNGGAETEFVSGSSDKTAVVWTHIKDEQYDQCVLEGHTGPVNAVDSIYVTDSDDVISRTLVVTVSGDSTVKIWSRLHESGTFECSQTLSFGNGFALVAALDLLPNTKVPVLVTGCDKQKINIYVEQDGQFVVAQVLHGHEDWIRDFALTHDDNGVLLLASSSHDSSIRIWKISSRTEQEVASQDISSLSIEEDIKLKERTFSVKSQDEVLYYAVVLDTILHGHDSLIYALHWHPEHYKDGVRHQPMCLLSASMDKTMILWRPDTESGVWTESVRVGEVGGNTLGLFGGQFSPDGSYILAHGYQGAFHLWHNIDQEKNIWEPSVMISGHFDGVQDLAWDPNGQYLLSTSSDQTTRLYAPWARDNYKTTWHEISRPQIHGYDMQCLAIINSYQFASAGDEKVIRIFEAPNNFVENFTKISQVNMALRSKTTVPEGASVPALGLSNKAIFETGAQSLYQESQLQPHPNQQYGEAYFKPVKSSEPPKEEDLLQNTLWPEVQKLYGHGYEVYTLACDPKGTVLASACKASTAEHAAILLWDVTTWRKICTLRAHTLTVTQMAFSHSGQYLLSVSRDRTWSLHKRKQDDDSNGPLFSQVAYTDKKTSIHSRIIWSCAWSHDDKYFVTSSRDKKVIVWGETREDAQSCIGKYRSYSVPLDLGESVTAVDMAPHSLAQSRQYMLAVGLDNGQIQMYGWIDNTSPSITDWQHLYTIDCHKAHHMTVKRVQFRKQMIVGNDQLLQLASCGEDHLVRIYNIYLDKLIEFLAKPI